LKTKKKNQALSIFLFAEVSAFMQNVLNATSIVMGRHCSKQEAIMLKLRNHLKSFAFGLATILCGTALAAAATEPAAIVDDEAVAEAKKTINRLMPMFKVKVDKKKGLTATNKSLTIFEEQQKKAHTNQTKREPFGYHILTAEIKDGQLVAYSKWTYRATNVVEEKRPVKEGTLAALAAKEVTYYLEVAAPGGEAYALNHSAIKVTVGDSTKTVPLIVAEKKRGFLMTMVEEAVGPITEECRIANDVDGFLRLATNHDGEQVVMNLIGMRQSGEFALSEGLLMGLAQTLELYEAIQGLKNAGEQIKERY
jgi:hypothetical protein